MTIFIFKKQPNAFTHTPLCACDEQAGKSVVIQKETCRSMPHPGDMPMQTASFFASIRGRR
jgi:hypothetical protein